MEKPLYQDGTYEIKLDAMHGYYHLFPVPSREALKEYYDKEFYSARYDKQHNASAKNVQEEQSEFRAMQYSDIVETLEKEAKGKKLIDIGCGYGDFLKFCNEREFDVFGLDPSSDAVAHANKIGVKAQHADIEDLTDTV